MLRFLKFYLQQHQAMLAFTSPNFVYQFLSYNIILNNPLTINESALIWSNNRGNNLPQSINNDFRHNLINKIAKTDWSKIVKIGCIMCFWD